MYARHDLIWLTPAGWDAQLAAHPIPLGAPATGAAISAAPTYAAAPRTATATASAAGAGTAATPAGLSPDADAVHAATSAAVLAVRITLERWRNRNWPLIIRRCERGMPEGSVCAGLAAPPDRETGNKLRIPLIVHQQHIARHERPLPLRAALPALPERWQTAFARLANEAVKFDMRVYGSLSMQALTGQFYLREASDIDIVFRPTSTQALDAGIALLSAHAARLPLDGEIVFPSGEAVAWKEWHASHTANARVLVKKASCVMLRPTEALRTELEAA